MSLKLKFKVVLRKTDRMCTSLFYFSFLGNRLCLAELKVSSDGEFYLLIVYLILVLHLLIQYATYVFLDFAKNCYSV